MAKVVRGVLYARVRSTVALAVAVAMLFAGACSSSQQNDAADGSSSRNTTSTLSAAALEYIRGAAAHAASSSTAPPSSSPPTTVGPLTVGPPGATLAQPVPSQVSSLPVPANAAPDTWSNNLQVEGQIQNTYFAPVDVSLGQLVEWYREQVHPGSAWNDWAWCEDASDPDTGTFQWIWKRGNEVLSVAISENDSPRNAWVILGHEDNDPDSEPCTG